MKITTLLKRVLYNRDKVLNTTAREHELYGYLAHYGYGWYKMGISNNPSRREKELHIHHFGSVKILATVSLQGSGIFTLEKESLKAYKDEKLIVRGEFVYIPTVDPEVVAQRYVENVKNTVKTLRKNTFNNVRKTNNILRKNGHAPIKADVTLSISK